MTAGGVPARDHDLTPLIRQVAQSRPVLSLEESVARAREHARTWDRVAEPFPDDHVFSQVAQEAKGMMLWYAWGRFDAHGSQEIPKDHLVDEGFRLARLWQDVKERYRMGELGSHSSLPDFYLANVQLKPRTVATVDVSPPDAV